MGTGADPRIKERGDLLDAADRLDREILADPSSPGHGIRQAMAADLRCRAARLRTEIQAP